MIRLNTTSKQRKPGSRTRIGWLFDFDQESVICYNPAFKEARASVIANGYKIDKLYAVRKWTKKDEQMKGFEGQERKIIK